MSTILASGVIKLSHDGYNFIVDGNAYTTPFIISNASSYDSDLPLHIVLTSDITISDNNTYLIFGSDHIVLNGGGHTITVSNVANYNGLIQTSSVYEGSVVENLNFVGVGTTSIASHSGVVASDFNGLIDHVSSSIAISGNGAGGIVGFLTSTGQISNSYTTGAISGSHAGGIVGSQNQGLVTNSYSTGIITNGHSGGIAGDYNSGTLASVYSTGTIGYALSASGGIAGQYNAGSISNAFTTGAVHGDYSGGIVAANNTGTISNVYTVGVVSGGSLSGPIQSTLSPVVTPTNAASTPSGWSDATAQTVLTGIGSTWIDPTAVNVPFTLASNPGSYIVAGNISDNNPWAGNTLQIRITDATLNGGVAFFADQAAQYGFGGNFNSPTQNLFNATYQWYADGVAIAGATAATLRVDGVNIGKAITAEVIYTNGIGLPGTGYVESGTANINGVFDTAANVSTYLDVIEANHSAISAALSTTGSFHILDGANTAVTGTMSHLRSNMNAVGLIHGGGYRLAVEDTANDIRAFFVANTYAGLNNFWGNFTDIVVTDSNPIRMDLNQLINTNNTFGQLSGNYTLNLTTTVSSADFGAAAVNSHLVNVSISDSSANCVSAISTLAAHAVQISSITLTDSAHVTITSTQAASLASAFNVGNDFHAVGRHDAINILYNAASDGTLYIKTSGATLGTLASGTSILFENLFVSTSGLVTNGSTTPFFSSSGGINGLTLPDLFTGPSSLGLTYQLIETAQNAVVTGSSFSEFIKVADSNSIGKAVNGNGGNDVIDGGVGSTFVTGGANHNTTFFLDGRAPGESWSTITDFQAGVDKATIWGFVRGVSSIDVSFINYNNEGAAGYTGLTFHFKNLLPDGQTAGSNPNLNSITFTGHRLEEFGASSLAELNAQINAGTNEHIVVGSTQDSLGTHSYLYIH